MKFASRKYRLVLAILINVNVLLFLHILDGGQFVTIAGWIISVYIGGNVVQKIGYDWSHSYSNRYSGKDGTDA